MTKYEPLGVFLAALRGDGRRISFLEIEKILGAKLPESAYRYSAWWSNNPSNNRMTQVWLDAGWRTAQVDIPGRRLVFEREAGGGSAGSASPEPEAEPVRRRSKEEVDRWWKQLYGGMKGTITIAEGVDLTAPTGERWKAQED